MKIKLAPGLVFDLKSPQVIADGFRCQLIGESGSGKSSALASIIAQALEGNAQVLLLDAHGEYGSLAAISSKVKLIGYGSSLSENLYAEDSSIAHYLSYLEQGYSVFINVAEWCDIDQETLDKFAIALLRGLYTARRRKPRLILVCTEEAQNFAPLQPMAGEVKKVRIFNGIMTGGRKFGIQMAWCSQAPALVNGRTRGACNVRIYLRISDANDWKNGVRQYIPDTLGLTYEEIRKFASGYAVVLSRWHEDQRVQLDRPTIAPNHVIPGVLR